MAALKKNQLEVVNAKYSLSAIKTNPLKIFLIVISLLFVGASGVAAYSYHLYQQSEQKVKTLNNPAVSAKIETQSVIDAVAKHMVLPKDETPTIATVTDSTKLKNQPFFAKASNGDKILIYTKGKKAILFNPSQNRIVEVAPVNIGSGKKSVAGTATQTVQPTHIPTPTVVQFQQPFVTYPPQPNITSTP